MTRRFLLLAAVCAVLATATACSTFAVAAATVNGEKITESTVEDELDRVRSDPTFQDLLQRQADELRGVARRNILTGLIRQSVIEQEARRRGITVNQAQVDRLIRQEAERQGMSVADFRRANNLSEHDARVIGERIVRLFELRSRVIEDAEVDDERVREAYEAQESAFTEVNLLRITTRSEQDAREVLEEVEDGATFADLAPDRSIDELADEGGDMGWVVPTTLGPEAQAAVESAAIGGVTDPVQSAAGWEIYRVVERRGRPFEDVEDELRAQLAGQERETLFEDWLGRRLRAAEIVVNPKYGRFDEEALQVIPGEPGLRR